MSISDTYREPSDHHTASYTECYGWRVIAASVRGTSHQRTGQPCQDTNYYQILPPDMLVAAVADGAGSASLAEVGATVAARAAVGAIGLGRSSWQVSEADEKSWRKLLIEACVEAQKTVQTEVTMRRVFTRDLASTLILAVTTPKWVAAIQIGDGAAVVGDSE